MDLSTFVTDQTQVVDVYICPYILREDDPDVRIGWDKSCKIPMHRGTPMHLKEYHHRDLCYTYDMENDAQRVVRKTLLHDKRVGKTYIAAYEEEVLPTHCFPCVQEITHEAEVHRISYRINNRMFLYHDKIGSWEYVYIRYQHAQNVDMKQMNADIHRILEKFHC